MGRMKAFTVAGEKVVVYHLKDGFYATQASCTHVFAPLARGTIVDGCKVQCPFHPRALRHPHGRGESTGRISRRGSRCCHRAREKALRPTRFQRARRGVAVSGAERRVRGKRGTVPISFSNRDRPFFAGATAALRTATGARATPLPTFRRRPLRPSRLRPAGLPVRGARATWRARCRASVPVAKPVRCASTSVRSPPAPVKPQQDPRPATERRPAG